MLAAGGNAIDAAIAALVALTVVEPMLVGILGGGIAYIRVATDPTSSSTSERGAARHRSERGIPMLPLAR
jgi:gamma-glutamyltranspeptidase/glutathione hydrolase